MVRTNVSHHKVKKRKLSSQFQNFSDQEGRKSGILQAYQPQFTQIGRAYQPQFTQIGRAYQRQFTRIGRAYQPQLTQIGHAYQPQFT